MVEIRTAGPDAAAEVVDVPDAAVEVRVAAGKIGRDLAAGHTSLAVDGLTGARLTAFVEGLTLGTYRFAWPTANPRSTPEPAPGLVELCGAIDDDGAVERGRERAAATSWARDLANTPAAVETPAWLGAQAAKRLTAHGIRVVERDVDWLTAAGFGGVLAVGGGSASPPRLIEASWRPRDARAGEHVVLVGKGITFDTGGVNRKLGDGMRTMHTDMSGGAAVLGALLAIAVARTPVCVTALVPAAENALSGSSFRPGDVVRHYGGRTSEIGNTDAEGRLVLADALAYAAARLAPTVLVDIATLTGAAKVALGMHLGGLFATSEEVANGLAAAGDRTGERLWRLPMPVEYAPALNSSIADATNSAGNPGAITAAMFLRPFAGDVPWAHLDIAGPARAPADDGLVARGATGFGARLLAEWVASRA